ncbi:MAG: hypothetical protein AVO33_04675 [delta proteobacterium ML8_F1]|nr:MAG: hypothetical protein AVO33_04675 [delta proteobacterium ML8_F1]
MNHVVITHAPEGDYLKDYVALPGSYGTGAYEEREDIRNIRQVVRENLMTLDGKNHWTDRIRNRRVLIKPNLVSVYYRMGFKDEAYPESTDPRVLDAIVSFVKEYTDDIVIIESSGRGMPTRTSFQIAGVDRIVARHGIRMVPLEEEPLERYWLPKARVMKEMLVPRILKEVVDGEAFYISVPKMKTNLYTGVTLGFKNAMGSIPYNLRQRNHNYRINEKLVDILYCYKPDLVVIDGIIGGEGNTPAPVDPVKTHMIISGDNSVETDWVATRMMGIDPGEIPLLTDARSRGFGSDSLEITGEERVVPFRRADQTLLSDYFKSQFPNVRYFVGHQLPHSPTFESLEEVTPEAVKTIEASCIGGCLAAMRQGFDIFYYQGLDNHFQLALVIGGGTLIQGQRYYFDREARPYTAEEIMDLPMKKLAFGSCARAFDKKVDLYVPGCMPRPTDSFGAIHKLTGQWNRLYSLKNKQLFKLGAGALKMRASRLKQARQGLWVEALPDYESDTIESLGELTEEESQMDYIHKPLPPLEGANKARLIRDIKKHSF